MDSLEFPRLLIPTQKNNLKRDSIIEIIHVGVLKKKIK
jgi:hypothetical protein